MNIIENFKKIVDEAEERIIELEDKLLENTQPKAWKRTENTEKLYKTKGTYLRSQMYVWYLSQVAVAILKEATVECFPQLQKYVNSQIWGLLQNSWRIKNQTKPEVYHSKTPRNKGKKEVILDS